ncbi:MAG: hypothetical protein IKH65_11250 [Clostridia bacterium]|nr:hypothetical protein [Clostridia bacterium]
MLKYINGSLDENRVLAFETPAVYSGEHNGSILKIDLSGFSGGEPSYYVLNFGIPGIGTFISNRIENEASAPAYLKNGFIYCPLTAYLTCRGALSVQLSAFGSDENGEEIEVKSSVADLGFGESLCGNSEPLPSFGGSIFEEIDALEIRIAEAEHRIPQTDIGYLCASAAARLLYIDETSTPLSFPETAQDAEALIDAITENYNYGETEYALTVIPAGVNSGACLCVIRARGGAVTVGRYKDNELLELLRNGVEI